MSSAANGKDVCTSPLCDGIAGIDHDREVDQEVPKENGTAKGTSQDLGAGQGVPGEIEIENGTVALEVVVLVVEEEGLVAVVVEEEEDNQARHCENHAGMSLSSSALRKTSTHRLQKLHQDHRTKFRDSMMKRKLASLGKIYQIQSSPLKKLAFQIM